MLKERIWKRKNFRVSKKDSWFLKHYPSWNNDKDVVIAAVQQYSEALEWASDELKNGKDVVLTAVKKDWNVLQYTNKGTINDQDIILEVVQQNGISWIRFL